MISSNNYSRRLFPFEMKGDYFLLDIPESRLYQINERMTRVIRRLQWGAPEERIVSDWEGEDSREDIAEDLRTLRGLDLLSERDERFTPPENQPLDTFDLQIAHHCNLDCKYCYARGGNFGGRDTAMSVETALRAIDFFLTHTAPTGELCISFDGGEPLLNFDLIRETAAYAGELEKKLNRNIYLNIGTNGVLITPEMAAFFKKHKLSPQISLDGVEDIHNELRPGKNGKGSFKALLEGIRILKEHGVKLASRITITPRNLELKETVELLHNLGAIRIAAFPASGVSGDYAFRAEHVGKLKEELDKIADYYLDQLFNEGRKVCFSNFTDVIRNLKGARTLHFGCGAGRTFISADPYGDLFPCHRMVGNRKYWLGSLENGLDHEKRRVFLQNDIMGKEKCRECWARYLCGGGCVVEAEFANGDLKKPDDISCEIFKHEKMLGMMIYSRVNARDKSLL